MWYDITHVVGTSRHFVNIHVALSNKAFAFSFAA